MSLNAEQREQLQDTYREFAEEVYIFWRALRNEGFDREEAMDIILAMLPRKYDIRDETLRARRARRDPTRNLDILREYIKKQEGETDGDGASETR